MPALNGRSLATLLQLAGGLLLLTLGYRTVVASVGYAGRIDKILPDHVGNAGSVTVNLLGEFPRNIASVSLWSSSNSQRIEGTEIRVAYGSYSDAWGGVGDVLTVRFDLAGAPPDVYGVSIVDADDPGGYVIGVNQLTVEAGTTPRLWVDISGRTLVRVGASTSYFINYGNAGNNDAAGGVLFVGIPKGVDFTLGFALSDYQLPALSPDVDPQGDSGRFEAALGSQEYQVLKLYVRDVPPMVPKPLALTINWGTTPTDHVLRAWWAAGKPVGYHPIWPGQ